MCILPRAQRVTDQREMQKKKKMGSKSANIHPQLSPFSLDQTIESFQHNSLIRHLVRGINAAKIAWGEPPAVPSEARV